MKTVQNPGKDFKFQHDGIFNRCPSGLSDWDDDVAIRLQRKFGVRIVSRAAVEAQAAEPVAETPEPEPVAPVVTEPPVEVVPEPPAAPIDGEEKKAKRRSPRKKAQE